MADIKSLKDKLVDHLIEQLENPSDDGVPGNVLTTASKVVKDFAHEITDDDGDAAIKDRKLAAFLGKKGIHAVN